MPEPISGREPHLSTSYGYHGQFRLSVMGLASKLNLLPASAISLPALAEALRSDAFYVRYSAARKLAERADREARLLMSDMLVKEQPPTRASIARHLYCFSWYSAEPLIKIALADPDHRVRESVAYALCDCRELLAYRLLAQALQNEEDCVRMAAAWGLRDCQDLAALPCMEAVLLADDPETRVKGLEALGTSELPQAMPIVRRMLNDPVPDVKYAATLSLIELAGDQCFQELSGVIGRTSGETLTQVLRGFFHATNYLKIDVGASRAADLLIDALETALFDPMPAAREAAIWPLAWMRHQRVPTILRQAYYRETDSDTRAQMMRVAVSLMSEVSEELLNNALISADSILRASAERIIADRATAQAEHVSN